MAVPGVKNGGGKRRLSRKNKSGKSKKTLRKNRRTRRKNKGGFMGGIIEQAIVPFGLFALQKKMQNRKGAKSTKKSKKVKK